MRRKKPFPVRLFFVLPALMIAFAVFSPAVCAEGTQSNIIQEQMQQSGAGGLKNKAPQNAQQGLNQMHINGPDSGSLAKFTPANLLGYALSQFKTAAAGPLRAVAEIGGIIIAFALLNTLSDSFAEKSMTGVFGIISALCAAAAILVPVSGCVSMCAQVIRQSSDFMISFVPVYSSLAAVSGHPASATAFGALLLAASEGIGTLASTTFVPMVDIFLAFCVVGAVSPSIKIGGLSGFLKSFVSWSLGLCLTVFTGILSIQGFVTSAADSLATKTAKFVVEGAVPVIGGSISDALNTVLGCASLLKTVTGAYAIVVFVLTYLPPVLECVVWMLAADLSLAAAEILGVENLSGFLKAVKDALGLLVALVAASAIAMIVSVSVMLMMGMGN